MASTSRPIRVKNQPSRNKDNVELNLELIEKIEANKGTKNLRDDNCNIAKVLTKFINSANAKFRESLIKNQAQKNERTLSKNKVNQSGDQGQWGPGKDKKKYVMGSGTRGYTKTMPPQSSAQEKQPQYPNQLPQKTPRAPRQTPQDPPQRPPPQQKSSARQQKNTVLVNPPPAPSSSSSSLPSFPKKPFKRASYHIGIAYTIYFEQLKQKNSGLVDHRKCDPTFFAKKLKSDINMGNG